MPKHSQLFLLLLAYSILFGLFFTEFSNLFRANSKKNFFVSFFSFLFFSYVKQAVMEHAIDLFTGKMIYLPSYHVFQRLLDIHFLLGGSQNNERKTKTAAGLPDIDNKLFSVLAATQTQKIDESTYLLTYLLAYLLVYQITFLFRLD
jgi:hypothetical protein